MKRAAKILLEAVLFAAVCYAAAYGASYVAAKYSKPRLTLYAI